MIVEEMPIAGVRVLGQGGVVSVERAADVVYDSIQIVERATLLTCKRIIPIEDLNCASNNAVSELMLVATTTTANTHPSRICHSFFFICVIPNNLWMNIHDTSLLTGKSFDD